MPPNILVTALDAFAPLDDQMGVVAPLTVPKAVTDGFLHEGTAVVALIDSSRIFGLAERLEGSGLQAACLFDGDDDDAPAPWLVRLDRNASMLRELFTASDDGEVAPGAAWHADAVIYLRTDLSIRALKTHFRRFVRIHDPSGKAFFFRFWEAHTAAAYFANLADRPQEICRWFLPREGGRITAMLAPAPYDRTAHLIQPLDLPDEAPAPKGRFTLATSDIAAITKARTDYVLAGLAARLDRTFPQKAGEADTRALVTLIAGHAAGHGIKRLDSLFMLAAWELHYGPGFDAAMDPTGGLTEIVRSKRAEPVKMVMLKERMRSLEAAR